MEPVGSLRLSQEPAIWPYAAPDKFSPRPLFFFRQDTFQYYPLFHADVFISPWSSSPTKTCSLSLHHHLYHIPSPFRPAWFYNPYNISGGAETTNFITQLSTVSCNFHPLSPKYHPQHHVIEHPQLLIFPRCERANFTLMQNRQNYSFVPFCILSYSKLQTRIVTKFPEFNFFIDLFACRFVLLVLFTNVWTLSYFQKIH